MWFFTFTLATLVVGALLHTFLDRSASRRTRWRVVELWLLWFVVGGGVWAIIGGLSHIGPYSGQIAASIGYRQSMFQWEVGWADIAVGVLGVMCVWKRDSWLTAAVVAIAILYWGDAVGHLMEWVAHGNTAPSNIGAVPSDILQPLVAVILLIAYRALPVGPPA
jgi:quinol-cytochrome oxidoreductase complex cytochrome b subunit